MALVAISHRKHGCCSFGDRVHDLVAGGSGDSTEEGTQDSRVSLLHGERTPRSPYTDAMESLTNGRQAGGGDYDADDDSDGGYICADYVLENTEDEKENDSQVRLTIYFTSSCGDIFYWCCMENLVDN